MMPSASVPINLRVEALSGKIGDKHLLKRTDWSASGGQLWGVLGANGAGKSTLLSMLATLELPGLQQSGRILVNDASVHDLSGRDRAHWLAYLPQHPETPASLSVAETVLLGRFPHRSAFAGPSATDLQRVDEALEQMDLRHVRERSPATLSGGERQRMHFARILAQDARVWLLDEPYGHLDFAQQARLLDTLSALVARTGSLVVVVAHDLFFLPRAATHMALLHQGTMIAQGETRDVWTPALAERAFGVPFHDEGTLLWPEWRPQLTAAPALR